MTAWIVFGDPCHTASPNEEQGLVGWFGMLDGYQMSRLTLHYSELEQPLVALLVFADFRPVMFC